MDGESSKKIAVSIFVVVLLLVGVLVGTLITRNISTSTNTKTQASQNPVASLEVLSPSPSQSITSPIEIKARVTNRADLTKLNAVFKVGDSTGIPMRLDQQQEKLIMTGSLNPAIYPKGRQTLSIYLYRTENNTAELIGSSVFYISL